MNHIQKPNPKSPPYRPNSPHKKQILLSLGTYDDRLCVLNGTRSHSTLGVVLTQEKIPHARLYLRNPRCAVKPQWI
jgi:hypothetical protein